MKVVVLAGGSGSRLRPLSTPEYPKQFIRLMGNQSLVQETRDRMRTCCNAEEDIFVSSQSTYIPLIKEHLSPYVSSEFFEHHIVCEPSRRNTFPAFLYLARYLHRYHHCADDEILVFCPSDHRITPVARFHDYLNQAQTYAAQGDIILFGIVPDKPETGYGYIQVAEHTDLNEFAHPISSFVEKPDLETAQTYLTAGNYFWNAGIFMLRYDTLLQEIRRWVPEVNALLDIPFEEFEARFDEVPALAIDVAIMEKTSRARVIPMHIQWSDIGSWDAVYEMMPKDAHGNVVIGESVKLHNTTNSLVYTTSSTPTLVSNMDRTICIQDDHGRFITTLGHSQSIKTLLTSGR